MDNNISSLNEPRTSHLGHRRTLKNHLIDLVARHGEDYAVEGKRLLRRLVRTVTIVGVLSGVLAGSLVVLVIRDLIR